MSVLHEATIFFAAVILTVPISRRLGLGSVLGYVAAGLAIGPWGLGLIKDVESILHFAEIGIVFMLFIIGLELQPSRLWVLRKSVFSLGSAQVALSSVLIVGVALWLGLALVPALVIGFGLSLSSTAFALQILAEKKELMTAHGKAAFGVLLFQDLAVIPVLAIVPLLGVSEALMQQENMALAGLKSMLVVIAFLLAGHFVLRPLLRMIASVQIHEIFTAAAMLLVLGSALLMEAFNLSMGLGAFLAGVLVAGSEYRHQLEADVEPFKGLLLGLFFIATGMSVNIGLMLNAYGLVVALVAGLVTLKFLVLYILGRLYKLKNHSARSLGFVLCQGGEFAFILFNLATANKILPNGISELLILVVTLSMALTPLLMLANEKFLNKKTSKQDRSFDTVENTDHKVVIIGFGRVGQIISRMLTAEQVQHTALEINAGHIDFVRKFGNKIYYGDASRIDLLKAAHVGKAKIIVLAIGDIGVSLKIAEIIKHHFPNLKIYARARNRKHERYLRALDINCVMRDTLLSSLQLSGEVFSALGYDQEHVEKIKSLFYEHDTAALKKEIALHEDEAALIQTAKESAKQLKSLFEEDRSINESISQKNKV